MDRADVEQEVTDLLVTALEFSERPGAAMLYCRHTLECMAHAVHFDQFGRYPDEEGFLDFTEIMKRIESGLERQTKEILWSINAQTRSSMHWSIETRREKGAKTRHAEAVVNQISATYQDLFGSKLVLTGIDIDSETIEDTIRRAVRKELSDLGIEKVSIPNEKDVNQDDLVELLEAVDAATEKGVDFDADEDILLGNAASIAGKYELAEHHYNEGMQYFLSNKDRYGESTVLNNLGCLKLQMGEIGEAERLFRGSLAIAKESQDNFSLTPLPLNNLGLIAKVRGYLDEAKQLFAESLSNAQDLDDYYGQSTALGNLGHVAMVRGHLKEAEEILRQALLIQVGNEFRREEGQSSLVLGKVMSRLGKMDESKLLFEESLAIARECDARLLEAETLNMIAEVMLEQSNFVEAEQKLNEALSMVREYSIPLVECSILVNLGVLSFAREDMDEAERYWVEAVAIAEERDFFETGITTRNNLGRVASLRGDLDEAERLYRESMTLAQEAGFRGAESQVLANLGDLAAHRGDLDEAEKLHRESLGMREEIGNPMWVLESLSSLASVVLHRDQKEAERLLGEFISIAREKGYRDKEAAGLWELGQLGIGDGHWTAEVVIESERFYGESLEIALEIGDRDIETNVYCSLGFINWWRGDLEEAARLFREYVRIRNENQMPLSEWIIENGYTDPDAEWDFPPSIDDTEGPH